MIAAINLAIEFISCQLEELSGSCNGLYSSNMFLPSEFSCWYYTLMGDGLSLTLNMLTNIIVDAIFTFYAWIFSERHMPIQQFSLFHISLVHYVIFMIYTTVSLRTTINWLYAIVGKKQTDWNFGQMFPMTLIGVTTLRYFIDYGFSQSTICEVSGQDDGN